MSWHGVSSSSVVASSVSSDAMMAGAAPPDSGNGRRTRRVEIGQRVLEDDRAQGGCDGIVHPGTPSHIHGSMHTLSCRGSVRSEHDLGHVPGSVEVG
jgi:hypothetical protein